MNARGTRRPHVRRPYKRPRVSGGSKKGGCVVILLAAASLPLADVVWGLVTR